MHQHPHYLSAMLASIIVILLLMASIDDVQLCNGARRSDQSHEQQHSRHGRAAHATVIIIGAGMSGIMAASTLSRHGIDDFLILEATDRIGGRMRHTEFEGYTIELGANWIEGVGGEKENPIWALASEHKLTVSYADFDHVFANTYDRDGKLLNESATRPRFDLAAASSNFSDGLSSSLASQRGSEDISILTSQRLFGFVPTTPLDMAIDYFTYDFEIAEPPRITSLKNVVPNPTFEYYGTDEYFVYDKRGYAYLVHQLAKGYLKHDNGSNDSNIVDPRLKLNKVVNHIKYSSSGVTITTEDNSTYTADYAIVSVSLGVLKSNLIDYEPDLPYWKIKTFYQFDMVIYTKIFLKFPYTFWPTGPGTEYFLYADAKRGYYPIWQHLDNEFPGSNLIFVTVTDDESRRIEQQPDDVTRAEIVEVLRKMFGKSVPEPESILVPRWGQDRFAGGSYMNWPIGVSKLDFDRMKAPVGPLYFTGEHTSAPFNGYVHGAYLAGIATAESLLDCIRRGRCDEITSDAVPWDRMSATNNVTNCTGTCCEDVGKERESLRQMYINTINGLRNHVAKICTPP